MGNDYPSGDLGDDLIDGGITGNATRFTAALASTPSMAASATTSCMAGRQMTSQAGPASIIYGDAGNDKASMATPATTRSLAAMAPIPLAGRRRQRFLISGDAGDDRKIGNAGTGDDTVLGGDERLDLGPRSAMPAWTAASTIHRGRSGRRHRWRRRWQRPDLIGGDKHRGRRQCRRRQRRDYGGAGNDTIYGGGVTRSERRGCRC